MKYDVNKNYYLILGVTAGASKKEITQRYIEERALADRLNDSERMIELDEAWKVLSDNETRKAYDYARSMRKPNTIVPTEPVKKPVPVKTTTRKKVKDIKDDDESKKTAKKGCLWLALIPLALLIAIIIALLSKGKGKKDQTKTIPVATPAIIQSDGTVSPTASPINTNDNINEEIEQKAKEIVDGLNANGVLNGSVPYTTEDIKELIIYVNGIGEYTSRDEVVRVNSNFINFICNNMSCLKYIDKVNKNNFNSDYIPLSITNNLILSSNTSSLNTFTNIIEDKYNHIMNATSQEERQKYCDEAMSILAEFTLNNYITINGVTIRMTDFTNSENGFTAGNVLIFLVNSISALDNETTYTLNNGTIVNRSVIYGDFNAAVNNGNNFGGFVQGDTMNHAKINGFNYKK